MTRVDSVKRRGSGRAQPSVPCRKLQLRPPLQRPITLVSGSIPGYSLPGRCVGGSVAGAGSHVGGLGSQVCGGFSQAGHGGESNFGINNPPAGSPTTDPLQALSDLLNKAPREIECRDFHLPDPPSNPMVFGKWKDDMYLLISRSVKRDPSGAIAWLSQVEHAQSVHDLARDATPFTAVDL